MSSLTIEVDDPEDAYENLRAMLDAAPVEFSQVTAVRLELEYESAAGTEDESDTAAEPTTGEGSPVGSGAFTRPPIADAEAGGGESATGTGADEITFRKPGEESDDEDTDGEGSESIFGDPGGTSADESVFSPPDDAVTFDDPDATEGQLTDDTPRSGDERSSRDPTDRGRTAGGGSTDGADSERGRPSPSPATYNKVVRLLQNREFPIERGEIEDVAVGAYDVGTEECRAVVDAAIERGLVAQEGSQLVDPTE